jgi:hypothetical protein
MGGQIENENAGAPHSVGGERLHWEIDHATLKDT